MNAPDRIAEAYRHCSDLVRAHDKDQFLAALFAPAERRSYLFALYAFAVEIERIKNLVREPLTGTIRLQWWLEAVSGLRAEETAATPVMIALQDAARATGNSLAPLAVAVEARQDELRGEPPVKAAATVFAMAARLLGVSEDLDAPAAAAAQAVTFVQDDRQKAGEAYATFCAQLPGIPERALPAFLPVALVPLRIKRPHAPQWRRQIALLRAAWRGFPQI